MARRPDAIDPARLIEDHYMAVYRYAYRLTGLVADAEDLTQQTFLVAQEKIAQLRQTASAGPWLFTVLRRLFLKRLRQFEPLTASSLDFSIDQASDEWPEDEIDREQLQAALNALHDEYRLVVLMYYFEDLSYREIAAELDIPIGTVMSRLSRAKRALRAQLSARQPQPSGREGTS